MVGVGGTVALGLIAALAFLYSGLYPIAANRPHTVAIGWALTTMQERSVDFYADEGRPVPDLADPALVAEGLPLYHQHCAVCHGAPGIERAVLGRGLNPDPPRLATEIRAWSDAELFWIVAHGLKMAGMPAFQPGLTDREVWATVALMRALQAKGVPVWALSNFGNETFAIAVREYPFLDAFDRRDARTLLGLSAVRYGIFSAQFVCLVFAFAPAAAWLLTMTPG